MTQPRTMFEKIWSDHVVQDLQDDFALIHVDRHIVHDLGGRGFGQLNDQKLTVRNPELTFATADHTVTTLIERFGVESRDNPFIENLRKNAEKFGFEFFDTPDDRHGIVHVLVPEQGLALPGMTLACGDSHSCTIGALGVLAWGIGQSELVHVLATQTSVQRKPKTMRIRLEGTLERWTTPKDVILHLIGKLGAAGGSGYAVEFCGPVIDAMPMEGRFTICNMAIEMGARFALIAPDETTISFLEGRPYAPAGAAWDAAVAQWRDLPSDEGATFDREFTLDVTGLSPQVTWGTSPQDVISVDDTIPLLDRYGDEGQRQSAKAALEYVALEPGRKMEGTPVDWVFIGSCTNARIGDLEAAASLARGRRVKDGVKAWVVPGSRGVKRSAEEKGLDRIFIEAGFHWGEPGCSLCGGSGGGMAEKVPQGQRILSTSNRNFVGRQGPGSRTHLASPLTAVATAIRGRIADVRHLGDE
ncbi:3-isopropylmalate dehydratase large subunit [Oricola sp.]|uniref:3-isopropylmalate dehydratase large subunit n=1 Tax=Oricola sp. TaxID=1979950 RepID=UPI0025F0C5C3|nr:3-isopropylmalate dehydratase large subunit [Oricola sp.]MCI5076593.1 3-isopropylmalate dehydratase large subunit [Oricola sp.]